MREDRRFTQFREGYFPEGLVRIEYELEGDVIRDIAVYTDALYSDDSEEIEKRLKGKKIGEVRTTSPIEDDIMRLLKEDSYEI